MEDGSEGKFWNTIKSIFTGSREIQSIEQLIKEAEENNLVPKDIAYMLKSLLRLGDKKVYEIMIPRTDIDCMEENATITEVADIIIKNGHSRIPIYRKNKDQIIGIIHAKDLLPILINKKNGTLKEILRPPLFVPETKNVKDMLLEFQSKKQHLAIAIDEYGGTSGLITLEDILEEIVGEIEDEYDTPKEEEIQMLEDSSCLVSGRTSLEDLKEQVGIDLESEFVETIGGYLTELIGRIPKVGEIIKVKGYNFQIKEADERRIGSILIYPIEKAQDASCNFEHPSQE
ncbi:hemolysin family protein [Desulfothermus naphthae]